MGDVLRQTIDSARTDDSFRRELGESFGISAEISIFDESNNSLDLIKKAERYKGEISSILDGFSLNLMFHAASVYP